MPKFFIKYDREGCIGAAACAAVSGKWIISELDGKADLLGSKQDEAGWFVLEITEEELQKEIEAAKACPVLVIHIKDENGNSLAP